MVYVILKGLLTSGISVSWQTLTLAPDYVMRKRPLDFRHWVFRQVLILASDFMNLKSLLTSDIRLSQQSLTLAPDVLVQATRDFIIHIWKAAEV